ncbi:MAG: AAA family ATPase [Acholeplasmataceae bacterium]
MVQARKITIKEFRGIRNLSIDFNGKNFAICGHNGTGKSGVVDALEFALTGNISRLSGKGTRVVSLKDHAPHVDSRNNPEKAEVTLEIYIPSIKKIATIVRNVKSPSSPIIAPDDLDIKKILDQVSIHPEFVLSRREIIKYVVTTPGERAEEVQALLRLSEIEDLRQILNKVANSCSKEIAPLERERDSSKIRLISALEVVDFNQKNILEVVNRRRDTLGLSPLASLTTRTSLKDGLSVVASSNQFVFSKTTALKDIARLNILISYIKSKEARDICADIEKDLLSIENNSDVLKHLTRENFLRSALLLINDDFCPVCDTELSLENLKKIVEAKLKTFEEVKSKRTAIEIKLSPLLSILDELRSLLLTVANYGTQVFPVIDTGRLRDHYKIINDRIIKIEAFIPVADTIKEIKEFSKFSNGVEIVVNSLEVFIGKLPSLTEKDNAKEYLTICQERFSAFNSNSAKLAQAKSRASLSSKVYEIYSNKSTEILDNIYKEVESNFSELYRIINSHDEGEFTAQLIPSTGKLGFDVNFYGRGFFPPGAYHSEGHQDSMGLCLYLALMNHLLGNGFTLAVLDDVLMSVDSGHRREVCNLLKSKFPNTQFILTTHDRVWLTHMSTVGLISQGSSLHFRDWNVDSGPADWNKVDVWQKIYDDLDKDEVKSAAATLRDYLEFISTELCHRLRAKVEFRGDAQFQLGDLLPSAMSCFKELLIRGESIATSWKKTEEAEKIRKIKDNFNLLVTASYLEQWQINKAIHCNEWANFTKRDFIPVVDAFKSLVNFLFCNDCNGLPEVVPNRGEREVLKCNCGSMNINLKK